MMEVCANKQCRDQPALTELAFVRAVPRRQDAQPCFFLAAV